MQTYIENGIVRLGLLLKGIDNWKCLQKIARRRQKMNENSNIKKIQTVQQKIIFSKCFLYVNEISS